MPHAWEVYMVRRIFPLLLAFLLVLSVSGCAMKGPTTQLIGLLRGILSPGEEPEDTHTSDSSSRNDPKEDTPPAFVENVMESAGRDLDPTVEEMVIYIRNNDADSAYSLFHPTMDRQSFDFGFGTITEFFGEFEEFELTLTNISVNTVFSLGGKAKTHDRLLYSGH